MSVDHGRVIYGTYAYVYRYMSFVTGPMNNHMRKKSLDESSLRISSKINGRATLNMFSSVHEKRH
jgi:hypothetical protein